MGEGRLLRKPEVSERTGIPENTLSFWRATNQGPRSARVGKHVVYFEDEVDSWIEAQFAKEDDGGSAA